MVRSGPVKLLEIAFNWTIEGSTGQLDTSALFALDHCLVCE